MKTGNGVMAAAVGAAADVDVGGAAAVGAAADVDVGGAAADDAAAVGYPVPVL